MNKILIIRLSSIGDIVLTSAFIRLVKNKYPAAEIDFLIKRKFSDLIKYNPHLNKVLILEDKAGLKDVFNFRKKINISSYDLIFDLHNNFRSKIISMGHGTKKAVISKDRLKRFILVNTKLNLYSDIQTIPQRYLAVGKKADIQDDNKGLELYWDEQTEKRVKSILAEHGIVNESNYVCISPGATYETKRWPIEYFYELIEKIHRSLNLPAIVLGSRQDKSLVEKLIKNGSKIIDFTGELSILESAAVIKKAKILVTNDSGLMHISAAVSTPVLAIFGSTVRELGFFPFRVKNIVLENMDLKCRPCSHLGKDRCPKKHFKCMKEITPEKVFNNLLTLLN